MLDKTTSIAYSDYGFNGYLQVFFPPTTQTTYTTITTLRQKIQHHQHWV